MFMMSKTWTRGAAIAAFNQGRVNEIDGKIAEARKNFITAARLAEKIHDLSLKMQS